MSRRHTDPVEVRTVAAPAGPVPDQFLWNGRRYVVREVLARWTESGSWWRGTEVRALMAGGSCSPSGAGSPPPSQVTSLMRAWGTDVRGNFREVERSPVVVGIDDGETQWWRVEADSGRLAALSAGTGVYDLCFVEATAQWSLKRVMD